MKWWQKLFNQTRQLLQQEQELVQLRAELEKLRAQNDSMRQGMRRCVTCDYRIDYKQRQDDLVTNNNSHA